jgi:hypothetical protein
MSHNSGYRPIVQAKSNDNGSSWSDHGIDLRAPTTTSGRLRAVAQEVALMEEQLQLAVSLLKRAHSEPTLQDPQFSEELDAAIVAFINAHDTDAHPLDRFS